MGERKISLLIRGCFAPNFSNFFEKGRHMPRGTIPKKKGEIWKLVEGTDDFYISNIGRFRHRKKLMKQAIDRDGYLTCNIGHKRVKVHRLVAMAFIPNPDDKPIVDHIDGNKVNNSWTNLRWLTKKENTQAAYDNGLIKKKLKLPILVIDENYNGFLYANQVEAAKAINTNARIISLAVRGLIKSIKGYRILKVRYIVDKTNEGEK